ncbi:MAG: hypothetical protein ABW022_01290 [Actinoplanes sp.]
MRVRRRLYALFLAVTMVGVGATPAAAAVGSPTELTTAGKPCVTEAPGPYLSPVMLNDADAVVIMGAYPGAAEGQVADFQVWDVTKPDEPQQWRDGVDVRNDRVYIQLEDESRQLDGVTYAWRVRVLDGDEASPWSDTCYYTVDRTGGEAPTVRSEVYPSGDWDVAGGGVDIPGTFVLTAASADTVSYQYRFYSGENGGPDDYSKVEADGLGGPATIPFTPKSGSYHSVQVYAIDRAGNYSDQSVYEFWVRENRPSIFSAAYPESGSNLDYNVGVPGAFEFSANVPDTKSFAWRIGDDGPSGSIEADDEGKATAMIAPTSPGRQTLYVQSVTADGKKHAARAYTFLVDNAPKVTGDTDRAVYLGSSLKFHFEPRRPNVEAYVWWPRTNDGDGTKETLPADATGAADLTWTATNDREGTQALYVQSRSADGTLSEPRFLSISIWSASPYVTARAATCSARRPPSGPPPRWKTSSTTRPPSTATPPPSRSSRRRPTARRRSGSPRPRAATTTSPWWRATRPAYAPATAARAGRSPTPRWSPRPTSRRQARAGWAPARSPSPRARRARRPTNTPSAAAASSPWPPTPTARPLWSGRQRTPATSRCTSAA